MGEDAETSEWLKASDAGKLIGMHPDSLRRWESEGHIKPMYTMGGHRRYKREDVLAVKPNIKQWNNMKTNRLKRVRISLDLLAYFLKSRDGVITDAPNDMLGVSICQDNASAGTCIFTVYSSSFPELAEGETIPELNITCTKGK